MWHRADSSALDHKGTTELRNEKPDSMLLTVAAISPHACAGVAPPVCMLFKVHAPLLLGCIQPLLLAGLCILLRPASWP